jgi:hypothetical protein
MASLLDTAFIEMAVIKVLSSWVFGNCKYTLSIGSIRVCGVILAELVQSPPYGGKNSLRGCGVQACFLHHNRCKFILCEN